MDAGNATLEAPAHGTDQESSPQVGQLCFIPSTASKCEVGPKLAEQLCCCLGRKKVLGWISFESGSFRAGSCSLAGRSCGSDGAWPA